MKDAANQANDAGDLVDRSLRNDSSRYGVVRRF